MNNMKNVYLMYAIVFLQGFVFYGPVATLFRQARGLSMSEIFIIEGISWVVIMALEVPWGWFSDRFGYKKTLLIANTLFVVTKIIFYSAHSFTVFLLERVLLSVVVSGLSGCDTALIYESIEDDRSQKIFGRYHAFATAGFLLASLISTMIVSVSIELTAYYTIFPYALAAFLTVFLDEVKSRGHNQRSIGQCLKTLLQDKTALLFVVSMALVGEVVHVITVFLNQSQYVRSGIEAKYFGLLVAMVQCASLMSVKASRISGKFGNMPTINSFTLLIILSSLILAITTNPVFSITCVVVLASSLSIITPIATDVQNKRLTSGNRATMLSIYSMLGGLVASMGDIAVGKMTDYSLQAGFLVCMVLGLIALSLSFLFSY